MEGGKSDMAKLREAILHYLQNNPNAVDSLEGIIDWWLPQAYKKGDLMCIENVLKQLIEEGLVKKIPLGDGTFIYRQGDNGFKNLQ